ncbi:malate dehydrogenase (oxaloacetate-decarboxylating)(NADP+) [Chitinophaga ginsengisegetis]|uniref:Malate dehydrogenase (Oxaloacetate-decarboxylating)(NADP+) n=1 Tax=Chitinophaga ginsengisegetis TaxID=393003 RepID=A0A1T5P4J6_9BACT|nr:NADP-dependent malic enzyme [Chitinophaga ginsengisegetis]MDR6570286.1 malate dehydrogenase (oxaloacetate-decarboxylating)(NADP+) [Chitinophaga ginsengisegetis]MDR6650020.1 malate dehydrogenase (oxaloacetate-decarboxylating)(NADP+) [Chitinophaga ginsengisegetis]MDR6656339.1 malate dehydrogenase (oxaloacetate-decarboxylating)(NADP+) [Chitinophaga ginsengisegetis]SKD07635.1 malate dehydrogenase (oxaloacetate-decarboxylating)(NADP+) [Chitinophaga ginsengisegetis]
MAKKLNKQDALDYHAKGRPGKIEVIPTKDTKSQWDLSLAYSPGVAEPCKEIFNDVENVYKYTAKGNLVGVISNGTAVLGLGDIGPEAGKPVMEGKAVLFKIFADIDVFDIELDAKDPDTFVAAVKALEPTFGGINLEDIKSPECFEIEDRLRKELKIPIMHDDQHGTAIISSAALLNALELVKKKIEKVKIVVNGAGAAAMACVKLYVALGAKPENFIMFDKDGVLNKDRQDLSDRHKQFTTSTKVKSLAEAMKGADVFLGLSVGNVVTAEMIKSMAKSPIVFAMANPDPEIAYETAIAARPDIIMATGRSDYPNQVNNVLGFPYIFRGALDVRATQINEAMKLAAVRALADMAKSPVPDIVNLAYNERNIFFGPKYIIPKPLDPRLLSTVAPAVAKAAMDSGVAHHPITDWEAYRNELNHRLGLDNQLFRVIGTKARRDPRKVVFAEADNLKVLKAAQVVNDEGIAYPILLGNEARIRELMLENAIEIDDVVIIDPKSEEMKEMRHRFGDLFFQKRQRKGLNLYEARKIMRERNYFGCMMVETGEADALISGLTRKYPDTIRPALQVIGMEEGAKRVAGMYIIQTKRGPLFLADTTVNFNPTAEELADITMMVAKEVKHFNMTPRIAMLSYSNFGSSQTPEAQTMSKAREIVKQRDPSLIVDGEIQAAMAFNKEILKDNYPFTELLEEEVNTLIFPNLAAGNIAYNLLQEVAGFDAIGPILLGMKKPVHILQLGSTVRQIVNMVNIAVVDAQEKCCREQKEEKGKKKKKK